MATTLRDVFEINGRGCVVLVEGSQLEAVIGDHLVIAERAHEISGIEMISYDRDGLKRLAEGWKPPLGLLLKGASKVDLVKEIGSSVRLVRMKTD